MDNADRPNMDELKKHSEECGFQGLYAWTLKIEAELAQLRKQNRKED